MKKTKICLLLLLMLLGITFVGCTKPEEPEEPKQTYSINIIDLDDEVIGAKQIEIGKYQNLYEAINAEFEVVGSIGEYGAYITSINNSIVDYNWSLMLYINDIEATTSCDKVIPEVNSVYEFRNICWAAINYGFGTTMDRYDMILDKTIYHYLKTTFKDTIKNITTYKGSTYWEMLTLDLIKRSQIFDSNISNVSFNDTLLNELKYTDYTKLTGIELSKYYIHAREAITVDDEFKAYYLNQITSSITDGATFEPYTTPFLLIPYGYLGDRSTMSDSLTGILTEAIKSDVTWGPTSDLWKLITQAVYFDVSDKVYLNNYLIDWTKAYKYGNGVDFALAIMAAAATAQDIRDTKDYNTIKYNDDDLDYIAYTLEKFYDPDLKLVKVNESDTSAQMSTNQIYAALIAYKVFKTTNYVANIFGPNK